MIDTTVPPRLTRTLRLLQRLFLLLLPWQTIWIVEERFLNGVKWEYGTLALYASEILLLICGATFVLWYWQERPRLSRPFHWSPDRLLAAGWLTLLLYILISPAWAIDRRLASEQARHLTEAIMVFWLFWLGPLTRREIIQWLATGLILPSLLGIWQFFNQATFASTWLGLASHPAWQAGTSIVNGENGRWLRAYGPASHPNAFGGALALTLILFTWQWKELPNNPIFQYGSTGILFTALFFTLSRSAWLAFGIGVLGLATAWKKDISSIRPIGFILTLTVIFTIIFWPLITSRTVAASPHEQTSIAERQAGFKEAVILIKRHPWIGVGPGNYTLASYEEKPANPGWTYQPVHNVVLLAVTELGIIGSLLFVICLALTITTAITPENSAFAFLCFCVFSVIGMFDHYFYSLYTGLMLSAIFWAVVLKIPTEKIIPTSSPVYTQLP